MGNLRKDNTEKLALNVVQFLFVLILLVMLLFSFVACGSIKEIPVSTIEKIEYRDSIIVIKEFVEVEVPKEKIVYVGPADTTSILATEIAYSEAKIDKGILTHTLEQKGSVKAKLDTIIRVEYVDKIIEREIPIEVQIEKKVTPTWCWWNLIYSIVVTLLIIGYIYIKLRL